MGNNNSSIKYKLPQTSPEQLEKLHIEFDKYDKNGNHLLEQDELELFLSDNIPDLLQFSRIIMDMFGSGKKDKITFENFQVFYNSLKLIGNNERDQSSLPMLIFSKLDKNNNYYISYKEIKYLLNILRPNKSKDKVTKKEAKKIIHDQKPAREEWGFSRDEFIKFFDSYISVPTEEESEMKSNSIPKIIAVGFNKHYQIGENPKPFQPKSLNLIGGPEWTCIAAGKYHTVIITGNKIVYGIGQNKDYQLGGSNEKEFKEATPLAITDKTVIWATCGETFTVYLTDDGKLIFCGPVCSIINKENPVPFIINSKSKKKFVYVSACSNKFCAIDSNGKIYIFGNDPRQRPIINKLSVPAYDVACGYSNISGKFYAIAVTVAGQAYGFEGLNNGLHHFSPIQQLAGVHVRRVYGYSKHLAVLTDKGQILTYGNGTYGQCGNGTNEGNASFKMIKCKENLIFSDVALGENHSIFITKDGETFSCGDNNYFQLGMGITKKPILDPTSTCLTVGKAVGAACGANHTLILVDSKRIQHSGMLYFGIKQ